MVQLAQFASDEQPKSGAALTTRKERLKNTVDRMRLDPGAAIGDIKKWPIARIHAAELDLDLDSAASVAVLQGVLAQIPNHLVQMTRVKMHFEIVGLFPDVHLGLIGLHGFAEFDHEAIEPFAEAQA